MKTSKEITVTILLNSFFENPYFYLKNRDNMFKSIFNLSDNERSELFKIINNFINNKDQTDPSKYNICLNIYLMCSRVKELKERNLWLALESMKNE